MMKFATLSTLAAFLAQIKNYFLEKLVVNGAVLLTKITSNVRTVTWTTMQLASADGVQFGGGSSTVKGYTLGLYIDASLDGAKWYQRADNNWPVQVNSGVKIYVPVSSAGILRVTMYYDTNSLLVADGATVSRVNGLHIITFDETCFKYINNISYICLTVTSSNYINGISYSPLYDYALRVDGNGVHITGDLTVTGSMTNNAFKNIYDANNAIEHGFYYADSTADNLPPHDGDEVSLPYMIQCVKYPNNPIGYQFAYTCSKNTDRTCYVRRFNTGGATEFGFWNALPF